LIARYQVFLAGVLKWRWAVLAASVALFVGSILSINRLGTEFLPAAR
jgi:multidrug efflux pump subunit AcrB